MLEKRLCRLACGALAALAALSVATAGAAVGDITSGLLRAGDAPPGFLTPHQTVYSRYTRAMQVDVSNGSKKKVILECLVPRALALDGWQQGVIQGFDTQNGVKPYRELHLCAWRFRSPTSAHAAYGTLTAQDAVLLARKKVKRLAASTIGDERIAIAAPKNASYALVFRRANAVVQLSYIGPSSLTPSTFLHLGRLITARLR